MILNDVQKSELDNIKEKNLQYFSRWMAREKPYADLYGSVNYNHKVITRNTDLSKYNSWGAQSWVADILNDYYADILKVIGVYAFSTPEAKHAIMYMFPNAVTEAIDHGSNLADLRKGRIPHPIRKEVYWWENESSVNK